MVAFPAPPLQVLRTDQWLRPSFTERTPFVRSEQPSVLAIVTHGRPVAFPVSLTYDPGWNRTVSVRHAVGLVVVAVEACRTQVLDVVGTSHRLRDVVVDGGCFR